MKANEDVCEPLWSDLSDKPDSSKTSEVEKVLCEYCGRTALNGIKCIGRCLADSEY